MNYRNADLTTAYDHATKVHIVLASFVFSDEQLKLIDEYNLYDQDMLHFGEVEYKVRHFVTEPLRQTQFVCLMTYRRRQHARAAACAATAFRQVEDFRWHLMNLARGTPTTMKTGLEWRVE